MKLHVSYHRNSNLQEFLSTFFYNSKIYQLKFLMFLRVVTASGEGGAALFLVVSFHPAHTFINSSFIKHSSSYPNSQCATCLLLGPLLMQNVNVECPSRQCGCKGTGSDR